METPAPEPLFSEAEACNFIKKRLWHRCFSVNFPKLLRTLFPERLRWLLLWWDVQTGLKQFDMTSTFSFSILILLTGNKWFGTPWGCYLINSTTLILRGNVVFTGGREIKIFSRYFEILGKIWLGNGIFNTRRCRELQKKITRNRDLKS